MATRAPQNNGMPNFDESFDVVVVGFGFAGAFSAIHAADGGCRVLLAEKQAMPGGISICSYGSMRCARDADDAFTYLKATNAERTPDDIIRMLAEGMTKIEQEIRDLAQVNGAKVGVRRNGGNYPFPGHDTFYDANIVEVPGFDDAQALYPHFRGGRSGSGWRVLKVLEDNVARRDIEVRCAFMAERLIATGDREVLGVCFRDQNGRVIAVKARRGVILACGGFESNAEMKAQYWEKAPVLPVATTANTGDGIRMAQDIGAALWHMWHYHGAYGFRYPNPKIPLALRVKRLPDWFPGREAAATARMCWIVVDRDGRRYMNEYPPYAQDTSHRPMEYYDPARQIFPRIPSYLIFDENGRKLYAVGQAIYNAAGLHFEWSEDNLREIELGIIKKADTLEELALLVSVDPRVLSTTIGRWNAACQQGRDEEFGRPRGTMMPIEMPPYYVGEIWPMVSNTQGGPVHNARRQIMDVFGAPIPRLYSAGELGSAFGFLYLSGGNLSECVIGGRTAGRGAAALEPWDQKARSCQAIE
ncbi:MAG TPA: FAD-dependent oxidoreductase [Xanthobacteraceae bacterium]|nr:FAD-dependent oxidoreductase [Xanthobacteraceae bacterium]